MGLEYANCFAVVHGRIKLRTMAMGAAERVQNLFHVPII